MTLDFHPEQICSYLTINELNVEDELATCPYFYYRFADLAIDAEREYNQAVLILEQYEASLAITIKMRLSSGKNDKITETEIKRNYRDDEKWRALKAKELDTETKFKKLDKAAKAFDMKNQSLMSLNKRQLFKVSKGMLNPEDL